MPVRPRPEYYREKPLVVFGRRIHDLRVAKGWTQEQFGHLAGRHWSYIGSIERGERNVSFLTVLALAKHLEVDPAVLVSMEVSKIDDAVLEMRGRNKAKGGKRRRGRPLGLSPRRKRSQT
jgi:transcriptional regulator with XRE-family HTH domain